MYVQIKKNYFHVYTIDGHMTDMHRYSKTDTEIDACRSILLLRIAGAY